MPLFYVNWPHWGMVLNMRFVNSKDYGVPQNRERVYIIGDITGTKYGKIFPLRRTGKTAPAQIIGGPQEAESITQEAFHQLSLLEQED